jgi:hypothetical protein
MAFSGFYHEIFSKGLMETTVRIPFLRPRFSRQTEQVDVLEVLLSKLC